MKYPKILAIETSCDETAAAVLVGPKIRSNIIYSQLALHQRTRGIVPEVASRAHVEKIIPVIKQALAAARVRPPQIDLVTVTIGPGLIGSLLVGVDTAKTLAYILKKPIIPINHVEAHIYANFVHKIGELPITNYQLPKFPAICLVVSGGHTSIILMRGHGNYKLLGSTVDDAAGEAFDKVANILGLSYPGGPAIAAVATKLPITNYQLPITLPRPMIDSSDFNFSFSGLKTAVLYTVRNLEIKQQITKLPNYQITAIASEFQRAVVDVLVSKTIKAARKYEAKTIILGGGVVANELLRFEMRKKVKNLKPKINLLIPDYNLCTDNAAIVGVCGYYKYKTFKNCLSNWQKIKVNLNPDL